MMNRRKMVCSLLNLMLTSVTLALALEAKATGGGGGDRVVELICDAYGIGIGRAKDKISEKDMIHSKKTKETLFDAVGKAKETVYNTAHDVQQQTKESFDKAKETGQTLKEHVVRNVSEAKGYIVGSMETVMRVVNLVGFATAYGMNVWITLISSYVMPRKAFTFIYPLYFRAMAFSIGIALLGHVLAHTNSFFFFFNMSALFQACNLLASLFTLFINKLISERMKIEKHHHDPPKEPNTTTTTNTTREEVDPDAAAVRSRIMKLNEKLIRFNSYSFILNIFTLISLTSHLLYFATQNVCTHQ